MISNQSIVEKNTHRSNIENYEVILKYNAKFERKY